MKNNNDNNIKANRKIKQINKVKSLKKKMKVRATVICYDRYCGSTLQRKSLYLTFKKSLNLNLKKSHFTLIQSIRLESIQLMLPKGFSFSKFFYIIGLVN